MLAEYDVFILRTPIVSTLSALSFHHFDSKIRWAIFHFVGKVDWYKIVLTDIIQVLIWPMSRLWWQEKYSIERERASFTMSRHQPRYLGTNGKYWWSSVSTAVSQIGIFRVGLTFMNWNGWKMKGQNEAVNRDDYIIWKYLWWEIML